LRALFVEHFQRIPTEPHERGMPSALHAHLLQHWGGEFGTLSLREFPWRHAGRHVASVCARATSRAWKSPRRPLLECLDRPRSKGDPSKENKRLITLVVIFTYITLDVARVLLVRIKMALGD
jgi:hypothetical protein